MNELLTLVGSLPTHEHQLAVEYIKTTRELPQRLQKAMRRQVFVHRERSERSTASDGAE